MTVLKNNVRPYYRAEDIKLSSFAVCVFLLWWHTSSAYMQIPHHQIIKRKNDKSTSS